MTVPKHYGGGGSDEVSHVLTLMEIAKGSASAGGLLVWNNSLYCYLLLRHGSEEQKQRYLPLSRSGEKPGCLALSGETRLEELQAPTAVNGGELCIHGGGSVFPCGVPYGMVLARSEDGISSSLLIVDLETPAGLRKTPAYDRGGLFVSGVAEMVFEHAPVGAVLCRGQDTVELEMGFRRESWLGVGALAAGIGYGCLEDALEVVLNAQGYGPVSQVTEWKLADMAVELEASELLLLKAAWLKDRGKSYEKEAASAKLFAAAAAVKAASEGLQVVGGKDPERRVSLDRRLRDAGQCQAYYGTGEQLDVVVADHVSRGRITAS